MPSIVKNDPWWFADPHRTASVKKAARSHPALAPTMSEHDFPIDGITSTKAPPIAGNELFERVFPARAERQRLLTKCAIQTETAVNLIRESAARNRQTMQVLQRALQKLSNSQFEAHPLPLGHLGWAVSQDRGDSC